MFMMNSFLFALLLSLSLQAEDAGQMVSEQGSLSEFEKSLEQYDTNSSNILDGKVTGDEVDKTKYSDVTPNIPEAVENLETEDNLIDSGPGVLGNAENEPNIRSFDKEDVLRVISDKSKNSFSFGFIKDDYDYQDRSNVFKRTYEESTGSMKAGMVMIGLDRFLVKKAVEVSWGFAGGLGFNSGKAQFIDGTTSEAEFKLYTIPLDLSLGLHLPLGEFAKITAKGGPSLMGLYQNRSDFEDGAKYKKRRQVGYGYFAEAKFQLSLSNIFRGAAYKFYTDYQVSQTYLDFKVRLHDYGNFQDEDIAITGQSFGIGFSFEYL